MAEIIIDDRLKQLYYQGEKRTLVAVVDNKECSVFYSEHTQEVGEVRDYIINSKKLFDGQFFGQTITVAKKSQEDIEAYFSDFHKSNTQDLTDSAEDKTTIRYQLKEILQKAANKGVSDIHIEMYKRKTLVKFRIAGRRKTILSHDDREFGMRIASVIFMTRAGDKESDFKSFQVNNGNLLEELNVNGTVRDTNWRCGYMPARDGGGKITIRWTDKYITPPKLPELNWMPGHIKQIELFIKGKPGLLIMAGQTNSGKTTTINSIVSEIPKSYSIHTIEDPPEFQLDEVIQTHTKPNEKVNGSDDEYLDQAYFTKALMRQDPDVVFLGEVRDAKAGKQVLRLGESGQKVFTTIHTSSPIGVPATLIEQFGLSPALVAHPGLLRVLIYQALVREVCPHCCLTYEQFLEHQDTTDIEKAHATETVKRLIEDKRIKAEQLNNIKFKNPQGCKHEACEDGEAGMLPLVEMLVVNDDDREFIAKSDFIGWKKALNDKGYKTVHDHAVVRIAQGQMDLFTAEDKIGHLYEQDAESIYGDILA